MPLAFKTCCIYSTTVYLVQVDDVLKEEVRIFRNWIKKLDPEFRNSKCSERLVLNYSGNFSRNTYITWYDNQQNKCLLNSSISNTFCKIFQQLWYYWWPANGWKAVSMQLNEIYTFIKWCINNVKVLSIIQVSAGMYTCNIYVFSAKPYKTPTNYPISFIILL